MAESTSGSQIGVRLSDRDRALIREEAEYERMTESALVRSITLKEIIRRREARRSSENRVAA